MVHVSPGFPASGGDSAPLVVEPSGRVDLLYQGTNSDGTANDIGWLSWSTDHGQQRFPHAANRHGQ